MANVIGKVIMVGDIHLSSKNYGGHRNYPKESLYYFQLLTSKAKEIGATHIIDLGDMTYGRFHTLEYRAAVEKELEEQNRITNGNRYGLQGNHDRASYGMTEYEYYVQKGLIKPATNLRLGNLNISMVDYGKENTTQILTPTEDTINVVCAHDFFKFSDTRLPEYGKAKYLDEMERWYGVDYLVCGHIHNWELFEGLVVKENMGYKMVVSYLGCMARPAYREGHMQDTGKMMVFTAYDNDTVEIDFIDVPLWSLEESFNIEKKQVEKEKEEYRKVDISDIVEKLDKHERVVGSPEDVIMAMENINIKYRIKAVELLREAQG